MQMDLASSFSSGVQFNLIMFKIQEHDHHTTVAVSKSLDTHL